jgi:hypothetical protein
MIVPGSSMMLLTSNRGGPSGQTHLGQQAPHGTERGRAAVHGEASARFQQGQGCNQTPDAEHVIEMRVCEQDTVEPTEPEPTPEQLALGPLATVHQEPAVAVQDDQRWQAPVDGRHTRGGAKENDFEQAPLAA